MALATFGLVFAAASWVCSANAASATGGDFNVLSINVDGLPEFIDLAQNKIRNSYAIGTKLKEYQYDIVHLQEDYNFHMTIAPISEYPHRTTHKGPLPIGDGLSTLSNYPWEHFSREEWKKCADADCFTRSGFTFMRVRLANGIYIDTYNLHTDHGHDPDDVEARAANLVQVSEYIKARSAGNAVLVFGSTNSLYSRPSDVADIFQVQNGMTDPWVQLEHQGETPTEQSVCPNPSMVNSCEAEEKIFYRGSRALALNATYFGYEFNRFVRSDDNRVLSPNNPVSANFTWAASSSFRQSNLSGGPHGVWFNDLDALPEKPQVQTITFSGGERLDSVGLTLVTGEAFTHGGPGGIPVSLTLEPNEFWTSAQLCTDRRIGRTRNFFIEATTSTGRALTAGTRTSDCVTYDAPEGWQITGYMGRVGEEVDQLAFIYAPQ
ncbi:uncharacterized protein L3040_001400 [Drepanopeziza brunnea f. sp. 'multigermtubi']|uniref:Endonuclease/Exonuclease/phosphatase n=1 Tax=Marssonina brunnea f. sp. multigermtubi (strain MB_m1) TaxID=1072389 RepID=K1XVH0_MARBU|nr:endonuclease/Exonuclease/phosphatase [Drepanopeziza brunnea f. sp. 'multigermtubi' MB_m1]EKD16659.1 endonuclease/Exonuclease/phosphatase [Drepanopeziza brunnea f. sp. 'multigermtubi' MB_m1]KAJ5051625.1 hypothetical protein L3040_001400 [Drepanopeziza brunnea f. sp. 'multigermtubi']